MFQKYEDMIKEKLKKTNRLKRKVARPKNQKKLLKVKI
jgi:hypothetical protein